MPSHGRSGFNGSYALPLQILFDLFFDVLRIDGWLEAADHVSFPVHEELGEVPLYSVTFPENRPILLGIRDLFKARKRPGLKAGPFRVYVLCR